MNSISIGHLTLRLEAYGVCASLQNGDNMKPNSLPEQPDKQPFNFQCPNPACRANHATSSPNSGLMTCRECGTEFYDGNPTDVSGMKPLLEPKKKTEPFKDQHTRG